MIIALWSAHACLWIPPPEGTTRTATDTDTDGDTDTDTDTDGDTDTDTDGDTDTDTGDDGPPTLVSFEPGSAGRVNVLGVSRALAGAELYLSSGSAPKVPVPGCASLSVDTGSPTAVAGPEGTASLEVFVTDGYLGLPETYQVVQPQNCTISDSVIVEFPVRVGRGLGSADSALVGEGAGDQAGYSVSGAGDVDGDGLDDVVVGAWLHDDGGQDVGRAYLVVDPATASEDLGSAEASFAGEAPADAAGWSVSAAGNVNGDAYDDLLVGALYHDAGAIDVGTVYLFAGPLTGDLGPGDAYAVFVGEADQDQAGVDVAGAGDVDDSGRDDILVGAHYNDAGGADAGRAYLFLDPAPGLQDLASADAVFTGEAENDEAGISVAGAGDVDGDGFDDLLIGARYGDAAGADAGRVYLVLGPVQGNLDLGNADATLEGEANRDEAGISVAGAGDVDGDGLEDLFVGARFNDAGGRDAGRAYLVSGRRRGTIGLETADAILTGGAYDAAGTCVSGAGNVDDDAFDDLLVGAPGRDAGRAYLVWGPATGTFDLGSADGVFDGESVGDAAGTSVSGVGDVDGDDLDDLLVGAPLAGDGDGGATYLVLGSSL